MYRYLENKELEQEYGTVREAENGCREMKRRDGKVVCCFMVIS